MGDNINVGNISDASAVAIGREAVVNGNSATQKRPTAPLARFVVALMEGAGVDIVAIVEDAELSADVESWPVVDVDGEFVMLLPSTVWTSSSFDRSITADERTGYATLGEIEFRFSADYDLVSDAYTQFVLDELGDQWYETGTKITVEIS